MSYQRPPERVFLTKDKSRYAQRSHTSLPNYDIMDVYGPDGFEKTIIRHRPTGKFTDVREGEDSQIDAWKRLKKKVEKNS